MIRARAVLFRLAYDTRRTLYTQTDRKHDRHRQVHANRQAKQSLQQQFTEGGTTGSPQTVLSLRQAFNRRKSPDSHKLTNKQVAG